MRYKYSEDIIANISTSLGRDGAIGIVRVSGKGAVGLIGKIFEKKGRAGELKVSKSERVMEYGWIKDIESGEWIDEVILLGMGEEKSYTREELVEIQCHGGEVVPRVILERVIGLGARFGDRGEFTRRAYLNGRINLVQAEAVRGLIGSRNEIEMKFQVMNLRGGVSELLEGLKKRLLRVVGYYEVRIDHPEEGIEEEEWEEGIEGILRELRGILEASEKRKGLSYGKRVGIVGRVNVGKSSLFNYLVGEGRSIVSDGAGTTRDYIEKEIRMGKSLVRLLDTAGFREGVGEVERYGQEKTRELMDRVEGLIWVWEKNGVWGLEEVRIRDELKGKNYIVVVNKMDLGQVGVDGVNEERAELERFLKGEGRYYEVSVLKGEGLEEVESGIEREFLREGLESDGGGEWACNLRQEGLLRKMEERLKKAKEGMASGIPDEYIVQDLREGLDYMGQLVGGVDDDKILDEIFENFCLGK